MLSKTLIATPLVAALALLPGTQAQADSKDFLAGAVLGGVAGAIIQKEVQKNREQQRLRARTVTPQTYASQPRARAHSHAPKRVSRPAIPVTEEGRKIQASLNYFGFDAGTVDGQVGSRTRAAIADYQRYMGYDATGTLTPFEEELLTTSHFRAQAGGDRTFQEAAGLPDGTKGLLKVYREDIANGGTQRDALPERREPSAYVTDI